VVIVAPGGYRPEEDDGGFGGRTAWAFVLSFVVCGVGSWLADAYAHWAVPIVVLVAIVSLAFLLRAALHDSLRNIEQSRRELIKEARLHALEELVESSASQAHAKIPTEGVKGQDSPSQQTVEVPREQIEAMVALLHKLTQVTKQSASTQLRLFILGLLVGAPAQYLGNLIMTKLFF
jgi:hypothetical protein